MDLNTSTKSFSLGTFLLIALAVIVGLFAFNMFSQQKVYDNAGNQVGSTKTRGKAPKVGGSTARRAA